jgi:hypothetical protein
MTNDKLNFLLQTLPSLLRKLDPATEPHWGKMNVQQMVEHMCDSVREANGKTPRTLKIEEERIPKMKEFLLSDKEFRPNTKNALMGDEPFPVRNKSFDAAIDEIESELKDFEQHYKSNPDSVITNSFFGHLDFNEWTHLLYKHAVHHLKQFGVLIGER